MDGPLAVMLDKNARTLYAHVLRPVVIHFHDINDRRSDPRRRVLAPTRRRRFRSTGLCRRRRRDLVLLYDRLRHIRRSSGYAEMAHHRLLDTERVVVSWNRAFVNEPYRFFDRDSVDRFLDGDTVDLDRRLQLWNRRVRLGLKK